jgi:rhamnulokinase
MEYLSFDLGASGGKMFRGAFDGEKLRLTPVHSFANKIIHLADGLYWDFLGIYDHMCTGIRKAAVDRPFHSFGIDSFNNDFSFINQSGELLFPLRSYRDPRTSRYEHAIYQKISPRALYRYTGNQIAPFNTFMQLAAMREGGLGYLFEQADRLLFLPDLLGYYLTGEQYTEYSIAAETQMLDWNTRDWIDEVLALFHIPRRLFAPLVMPGSVVGRASPRFMSHVAVCEHDTASAFIASPVAKDTAILSCGTWSIIGAETNASVINDFGYEHNIANEGSLPGYHRLSVNVMGLWIIQQLRAEFALDGRHYDFAQTQSLALLAPPFAAFINPDNPVFYHPGDMAVKVSVNCLQGSLEGHSIEPGALFRCVYESLAFQYRWALGTIERLLGRAFKAISIIGGGAQDELLCQFTANALNLPVIAGPFDATSAGNILVQMQAHGAIRDIAEGREVIRRSFLMWEYLPQSPLIWQEEYSLYCALAHPGEAK